MKTLPLMICALTWLMLSNNLMGQERVYDLSNYKARYELRPGMRLYGSSDIEGDYATEQKAFQKGYVYSSTSWFMNRNTEERISFWSLSGRLHFPFGNVGGTPLNPGERYNRFSSRLDMNARRDYYQKPEQFWGWSANATIYNSQNSIENGRDFSYFLSGGRIYRGKGRIEFAQDALLANWILEDLQSDGVTNNYTAEDVEALALTITDIIGNRVFDFRRRRIYELEQLQKTLLERGVTEEESFQLFAILNDNWAFANRATLTHGNRFSYGLSTSSNGNTARWEDQDRTERDLDVEVGGFAEYNRSCIVNNNGSATFTAGVELAHYMDLSKDNVEATENISEGWFGKLYLGYNRTWLPNSRTKFTWRNTFATGRILQTNAGRDNSYQFFYQERLRSSLRTDYFVNYQWSFTAELGFDLFYFRDNERVSFNPNLSFRTNYFLF